VDAHELLARDGQQPERIRLAQVRLERETDVGQIVQRVDVLL